MKITYSIPLQTVTLEWTPEEQVKLGQEYRAMIKESFMQMIADLKAKFHLEKTSSAIEDMIDRKTP